MSLSIARTKEDCCSNDRLRAALFYIQQGWALIPLEPMGKRPFKPLLPVIKGQSKWEPLAHRPATEEEVISWFNRYPDINIGVITGQASGLVVIDYDTKTNALPIISPTVQTGRGYHLYLTTDEEVPSQKFPKVDVQAEGKYVVLPPSIHPDGSQYTWAEMLSPREVEFAVFTPDLLNDFGDKRKGSISININSYTPSPDTPYIDYQKDEKVAFAVINKFGRDVKRLGKSFRCVLPGHDEKKPSASLYRMDNGIIALKDFHKAGDTWLLPDVYASCTIGKAVKLKKGDRFVWWLRALSELGFIKTPAVMHHQLPDRARESVQKVYKGFILLEGLRKLYNPTQQGTPYTVNFIQNWCGISGVKTAMKSMSWLVATGYIKIIEKGQAYKKGESVKSTLYAIGQPKD